ncbi:hypothetical protein JCM5296_003063 [Sporobolomyces johnsonii]
MLHRCTHPPTLRGGLSSARTRTPRPPFPLAFTAFPRRDFSLWPSSPEPQPPPPVKPSLADFVPPAALPASTYLEPLTTVFLSLPPALSLSYAAFIPLFTVFYRSITTIPITLWQRRRTRKFAEVVMPEVRSAQARIALETRDECRRAGKSYEEYQKIFQKKARVTLPVHQSRRAHLTNVVPQAKKVAYALARKHRCSPRLTLLVPPLVHVPILITATLVLRDACVRAIQCLNVTPSDLPALLSASESTSALTATALAHLHELAATPFLWCSSLALPDPTLALPLAVSLAMLLNVEVTARTRQAAAAAATGGITPPSPSALPATGPITASEKRRFVARRAREGNPINVRGLATQASPAKEAPSTPPTPTVELDKRSQGAQVMTTVLRSSALMFIPVAAFAPSAVCVYWLTSNVFSLVQNLTFAWLDRTRAKEKRMRDILSGRSVGV